MLKKNIEQALLDEIATILSVDPATILPDIPFQDLGIDSLSFVELLVFIEKEFKLKLIESGLTQKDFASVNSLKKCIEKMV